MVHILQWKYSKNEERKKNSREMAYPSMDLSLEWSILSTDSNRDDNCTVLSSAVDAVLSHFIGTTELNQQKICDEHIQ